MDYYGNAYFIKNERNGYGFCRVFYFYQIDREIRKLLLKEHEDLSFTKRPLGFTCH
jgi:hypothetical protein